MAKRLVIVESPTKAKTVQKMLGASFDVVSSFGHIRDLPKSKLGVDVEHAYAPQYVIPPDKRARVTALKAAAKSAENIFLATDDDREGEAIAWHIAHVLNMDVKSAKRIVFHEITKHAVEGALNSPRSINIDLVDAQQARRVLDRLVGYELSPFLWKKVARGLSAGRVQSVAVRFVVERERERQAFKSETYFSIEGDFVHANGPFHANLLTFHGDKMQKMGIKTREQADDMLRDIQSAAYHVGNIETSPRKREPKPPFKTSTLQQEANNKLGMSSKLTMRVAQQLYEGVSLGSEGMTGLITYMRTDSFNLSEQFILGARAYAQQTFGKEYVSPSPRVFKTTAKGAQEAHEAIRPTDPSRTPESIKHHIDPRQFKLYDLIWRRAIATQMATAQLKKETVAVESDAAHFQATGSVIVFPGFLALYKDSVKETVLPNMQKGDDVAAEKIEAQEHVTEPPARYSDATLVKVLEEHGIGRPSTYAPTISTILDRGYVERDEQKRLAPTDIAFTVNDLLVEHFPNIVDAAFTARMESELDDIENGEREWQPTIDNFYKPFHENLVQKEEVVDKKELTEEATNETCEKCGSPMVIKLGRFGKFMACSNYPECKNTIRLNRDGTKAEVQEPKVLGIDLVTNKSVTLRDGRFGVYVQLGEEETVDEKKVKPKRASLLRDLKPEDVTLDVALSLLALPRTLGVQEGNDVTAHVGRFGPYVACGKESRSIPARAPYTVLTITLEQAIELLKQPKRSRKKKE